MTPKFPTCVVKLRHEEALVGVGESPVMMEVCPGQGQVSW